MSYYKQSGVTDGLLRSINQGMSSRVKTGDEYANTRLNNAEFGLAGRIAGVFGNIVSPKWRPMFLAFSQSKMAKAILEIIKADNTAGTTWGTRGVPQANFAAALQSLNMLAKNDVRNIATDVTLTAGSTTQPGRAAVSITIALNPNVVSLLAGYGATRMNVYASVNGVSIGNYSAGIGGYDTTDYQALGAATETWAANPAESAIEFTAIYRPSYTRPQAPNAGDIVVSLVFVPVRVVNGEEFELQERATFEALIYTPA